MAEYKTRNRAVNAKPMIAIVAMAFFISGIYSLVMTFRLRDQVGLDWPRLIIGVIKLAFAFVLMTQTRATAVFFVWLAGGFLLLLGAVFIWLAWRLRDVKRYLRPMLKNEVVEGQIVDGDVVNPSPQAVKELPDHIE